MSLSSKIYKGIMNTGIPIFGSVRLLTLIGRSQLRSAPLFAPWTFPVVVGGTWLIYYTLNDEWKQQVGLMWKTKPFTPTFFSGGGAAHAQSVKLKADIAKGEFTTLQAKWDTNNNRRTIPGDDDDDEEEEEEEEDEEEDD